MDILSILAEKGVIAAFAAVLLYMQIKQDNWTRQYLDRLQTSIDELTDAIKGGIK